MIIKGKLISCKREAKRFTTKKGKKVETDERLNLSLAEVTLSEEKKAELLEAFAEAGDKFTPGWLKDFKGYINLATNFDLPARDDSGHTFDSVEDLIADGYPWMGAVVKLAINVKEGAIYPAAITFVEEGKQFNPFEAFDNEDED